ncbi:phosphate-starvation-inducible PsiE family protein [Haloplanus sp. C73]|uniref:phosphate-starvation-inducible PsiE family protein n=1 Tax=Haloplanus sp. C73 TaxID=3421641 RepID=UPI003EBF7D66
MDERRVSDGLERAMRALELGTAGLLVVLFAVGAVDFGLQILELGTSGRITDPRAVVGLIDTALLLFIIVEVFLTVIAYSRDESVVRIVLGAGLIAIARKIITFRTGAYASTETALFAAASYGGLLAVLGAVFYGISHHAGEAPEDLV